MNAAALIDAMMKLRRSHAHAPPSDVLDLVLEGREFGQVLAAAFDECMTPLEWAMFTGPNADPALHDGCLASWRIYAIARFESRYAVTAPGV